MTPQYFTNAANRIEKYVSGLKYGASFKYVKGLTKAQKTLLNILYTRRHEGGVRLTNREMEAFEMKPSDANGMVFVADVTTSGKPTIVPVSEF